MTVRSRKLQFVSFRAYIGKEYVTMVIAKDRKTKYALNDLYMKEIRFGRSKKDFMACCYKYRYGPEVARILFCYPELGAGVVAHEIFHAVVQYMGRHRITNLSKNEERLAGITDELNSKFWLFILNKKNRP